MRRLLVLALLALSISIAARPAAATYSIVATDSVTSEIGGAAASCVSGDDVYVIYGSAPGRGVVHAQATYIVDARQRAVELLEQGIAPEAIVDEITAQDFDPSAGLRQYGIVDVEGRIAGFTGERTRAYAADVQGEVGTLRYSVQGNILTGAAVLTQAASGFEAAGCDLADRLMRALEAGAEHGEGDSRCTPDGIPADSAYLQVDRPGEPAGSYLSLRVPTSGSENPLLELRAAYERWRATHPCPAAPSALAATQKADAGCACSAARGTTGWPMSVLVAAALARRLGRKREAGRALSSGSRSAAAR